MRLKAILPVLALATACASSISPQLRVPYPPDSIVRAEDGFLYEAEAIAPQVHVLQSPEPFHFGPLGNVAVIEQSDGFVLVDAGGSQAAAERIIAFVHAIDARKPVKAIVVTHWHGDHVLGLRTLLSRWPRARAISTEATRASLLSERTLSYAPTTDREATARMADGIRRAAAHFDGRGLDGALPEDVRAGYAQAAREMRQNAHDLELPGSPRMATTETFTDGLVIADREAPVEVMFLGRANTDGDAVVWMPRQRILITGDIVVSPMPYGFSSYPRDWLQTLALLKAFHFSVLIPGHGRPMRDRVYLDRLTALIEDVRRQVGALAAQGLTLEDVRKRVDFTAQRDIFAGSNRWRRTIFDYYWVEPIVTSAYGESKGEPILQGDAPE